MNLSFNEVKINDQDFDRMIQDYLSLCNFINNHLLKNCREIRDHLSECAINPERYVSHTKSNDMEYWGQRLHSAMKMYGDLRGIKTREGIVIEHEAVQDNGMYDGPQPCDQCRGTGIEDEVGYPTRDCLSCSGSG